MSTPGDGWLVRRVLDGDTAAYRLLVERHEDVLFRRAVGILHGDADLAADMVQEAFVRAYERLASCSDPDRFGGWVYRAVRNRCYDELRAARRRNVELGQARVIAGDEDPERDLSLQGLRDAIGRALDALTPPLREAFVMKHVDGLSYDEMQAATGVRRSALKMRVMRAREELERLLAPVVQDDPDLAGDVTPGAPESSLGVEAAGPSRRGEP